MEAGTTAPSADQEAPATEPTAPSADAQPAEAKPQSAFFVCVPGSAFGTSVFNAEDEQDAANQYAASVGLTPLADEEGNDTVTVAVVELNTVKVDHNAVKEINTPKE